MANVPDPTDLITLEYYQVFIGDAKPALDEQRQQFITAASNAAERYCGRGLKAQDRVEYYSATGVKFLGLGSKPVNTISQVTVNPYSASPTVIPGNQFYVQYNTGIAFKPSATGGCYFMDGYGEDNYKVEYNGGYDPIPADLKKAICLIVQAYEQLADPDVLLVKKSVGDVSVQYASIGTELNGYHFAAARETLDLFRVATAL